MSADVLIIDTRVANVASVRAAFGRLGLTTALTTDAGDVERAERLVLPGVGSFGAGMARLEAFGLCDALRARVEADRSMLAICLGMQLLCAASEECPGVAGLGVVPASITALPDSVMRPQFGFNDVNAPDDAPFSSGCAYFANSYCLAESPAGWGTARTTYGLDFVSALWRGRTLACQFHPELSGAWGLDLLARWAGVREPAPC